MLYLRKVTVYKRKIKLFPQKSVQHMASSIRYSSTLTDFCAYNINMMLPGNIFIYLYSEKLCDEFSFGWNVVYVQWR